MKVNKNNSISYTLVFAILLTIAFIVLKLCNVIQWSWLWVFSPLWIDFAITILIAVVIIFVIILNKDNEV